MIIIPEKDLTVVLSSIECLPINNANYINFELTSVSLSFINNTRNITAEAKSDE